MKKLYYSLLVVGIFTLVAFAGLFWWKENIKPASSDKKNIEFVISKGSTASQIGEKLKNEKIIRSALAFKVYLQSTGNAGKIQAGEYILSPSYSLEKILNELLKGPVEVWVTIPEGLRREEIAEKFITGLQKEGVEKDNFREEFLQITQGKEGYLFPDTYLFPKTVTAEKVVLVMEQTFERRVDESLRADIGKDRTLDEIITVASLIEKESKGNDERPLVAGVIYKRLEAGWPLQIDAAVQYAVASSKCKLNVNCNWWPILTTEDIGINSSYNTYKYKGLPPSPIANPGLSSIKASINLTDSSYWFYLHDDKGQIHFAQTIEEHNDNIKKYLGK